MLSVAAAATDAVETDPPGIVGTTRGKATREETAYLRDLPQVLLRGGAELLGGGADRTAVAAAFAARA